MPYLLPCRLVDAHGTIVSLEVELADTVAELKVRLNVRESCAMKRSCSCSNSSHAGGCLRHGTCLDFKKKHDSYFMKYGQLTQALNLVFEGRILADDETVEEATVFAHWLAA